MWLRAARNRILTRGVAVALALLVCGSALEWGHFGGDDVDCDAAFVLHDYAAHRFRAGTPHQSQPADHCYICHSLRALHGAIAGGAWHGAPEAQSTESPEVPQLLARTEFAHARASRAPPTSLL